MNTITLRGGVELDNALELAREFLEAYASLETNDSSGPASFDESDLRLANRGGARISAAQIAAILERRGEAERALGQLDPDASLTDATSSIPWVPLTRLFDAFADIHGVGFSKTTKALHRRKRPALIPMLDSVVQVPGKGSAPDGLVCIVRGTRHCARPNLQARPGSQPVRPAGAPARARKTWVSAHRGANPRHRDLVRGDRDLNQGFEGNGPPARKAAPPIWARWKRIRRVVLGRHGYRCRLCGGELLATACLWCHGRITASEVAARRRGTGYP